jgi:hypothetical protein
VQARKAVSLPFLKLSFKLRKVETPRRREAEKLKIEKRNSREKPRDFLNSFLKKTLRLCVSALKNPSVNSDFKSRK